MNQTTDVLEDYAAGLEALANRALQESTPAHEYFESAIHRNDIVATDLLQIRESFLNESDRARVAGLLPIGFFRELTGTKRITAFVIAVELSQRRGFRNLQRRFEEYRRDQPIFTKHPNLWQMVRGDLIREEALGVIREDGVITLGNGVVRLEPYLNPNLLAWTRGAAPDAELAIRLDPYFAPDDAPLRVLLEAILLPANPKWWQTLDLRKGTKDGGQYALEAPINPRDNIDTFWDYHVRHVRRLEVHAVRRQHDYLSMMIEELVDSREEDGLVLGRCIHWDTTAPTGTPVEQAATEHLDLAINVYSGEIAARRMAENLANGKVVNATMRTHLLRVDHVPVPATLAFAEAFCISRRLIAEWFNDQFS